ncbi:Coq4 family protein [Algicola sagamiensis]|uniref:Coq4 family protein n=1 Tax=Algicola sagamiensis TaxID=163869 RepID=UPI00035DA73D|nr:Coq4 family protein [Algicola sagamiensis]
MHQLYATLIEAAPHLKQYIEDPGVECSIAISNIVNKTKYLEQYFQDLYQHPEVKALVDEKYLPETPSIDEMCQMRSGSLGHTFGHFMREYGLSLTGLPEIEIKDDKTYFMHRARSTHDFFHVALGVPPTMPGELAIQGFQIAQVATPVSKFLCSMAFLRSLEFTQEMYDFLDPLVGGYLEGRKAKVFLGQRWEERLEEPLEQVRESLNVRVVPLQIRS